MFTKLIKNGDLEDKMRSPKAENGVPLGYSDDNRFDWLSRIVDLPTLLHELTNAVLIRHSPALIKLLTHLIMLLIIINMDRYIHNRNGV